MLPKCICKVNDKRLELIYLFYLCIFPPDLQKNDGGADIYGKQLPRPDLEMPRYCCPVKILFGFLFYRAMTKIY